MKKHTKRLPLRLESIRSLSSDSWHRVAGGAIDTYYREGCYDPTAGCEPNTQGKNCGRPYTTEC